MIGAEKRIAGLEAELEEVYRSITKLTNELASKNETLEHANRTIRRQQEQLIEGERLKVMSQMAGAAAHELNQPLTAVLGYGELLTMQQDCPPEVRKTADQILKSAGRIRDVVREMQRIHRYETEPYIGDVSIIRFDQNYRVLIIEDEDEFVGTLKCMLAPYREHLTLDHAKQCAEAEKKLADETYDLVLADYQLPDGTALELLAKLGSDDRLPPFILITGRGSEALAIESVHKGVYDYLPKVGFESGSLSRTIWSTLERVRLEREVRAAREQMAELATRDRLTGLVNRRYLMEALALQATSARRYGHALTLCMLDIDQFKQVNCRYGYDTGDKVLQTAASLLCETVRTTDTIGRCGGDEFLIILTDTDFEEIRSLAEQLRERMAAETHTSADGTIFKVTCSMGLAEYCDAIEDSGLLVKLAEDALRLAKNGGYNKVCVADLMAT